MIKLTFYVLVVSIAASTGSLAFAQATDASAELLQQVNKYYAAGEYNDAIRVAEGVKMVDKYGEKYSSTASIYATMGTCTFHLAQKAEKAEDSKTALKYYKMTAEFNRLFADALMIHNKTPGITTKTFDDDVEFFK